MHEGLYCDNKNQFNIDTSLVKYYQNHQKPDLVKYHQNHQKKNVN